MKKAQFVGSIIGLIVVLPIVIFATPGISISLGHIGFSYMLGNLGSIAGSIIAGQIVLWRMDRKLARLHAENEALRKKLGLS